MFHRIQSNRIVLATSAVMLAFGFAGGASAATGKKAPAPQVHSQASLQCSADATAKGLHGKARVAFRRDCLRKATVHHTAQHKAPSKAMHRASTHTKAAKPDKKA